MNYFEVLGVRPSASDQEIATAYKLLAKSFHPDQHPEASPGEKAAWTAAMARINEAWNALRDPGERRVLADEPRQHHYRGAGSRPSTRVPFVGECDLCGSGPAERFRFRHQHAYVFRASIYLTELELCRSCAQALGRSKQNRTLLAGWWGVISVFRNLGIVFSNATELRRAAKLGTPRKVEEIQAPFREPMNPGKMVLGRAGIWVTAAAVAAVGTLSAITANPAPSVEWAVGSCVSETSQGLLPVSCSQPHSGRIVGHASSEASCPASYDGTAQDGSFVWCIDTDQ